jgi:hypothetical protein
VNRYRVLLTRAREGMVLWVPPGSAEDPTRGPELYDPIAEYLVACGVPPLTPTGSPGMSTDKLDLFPAATPHDGLE